MNELNKEDLLSQLKEVKELLEIKRRDSNGNQDDYMLGMCHGMELVIAAIEKLDLMYHNSPRETPMKDFREAIDTYDALLANLRTMYIMKNEAYGGSFDNTIDTFGYISAVVRMHDKMGRLQSLIVNKTPENDESVLDTLKDLANYSIMFASKIIRDGGESK